MKRILSVASMMLLCTGMLRAQSNIPQKGDPSMFRAGYDIPAGVLHGTWDFDEWPGVDHNIVYKRDYMYNTYPNEKIKIDYFLSLFDKDDHEGYLKSPEELKAHGFSDMDSLLRRPKKGTIVGIFAHPDDELLLAGGLLARAAALGWNVHAYLVSNGADGSKGQTEAPTEAIGGYNAIGVMPDGRTVVSTDVQGVNKLDIVRGYAAALGVQITVLDIDLLVAGRRLRQIGEVPGLDFARTFGSGSELRSALQDRLTSLLAAERPDLVFTHGTDGEYANFVHKTIHDLVLAIVRGETLQTKPMLFTCMPEYNYHDHISHYLDLDAAGGDARSKKWEALKRVTFLYGPGKDYDKPWDPNDTLMDGEFVKDYGYAPTTGEPPRYEFFARVAY